MKLKIILIILILLPLVFAQSCKEGDGCNPDCLEGDPDCSCKSQHGIQCSGEQFCPSQLLKNWDNNICCSEECLSSEHLSEKNNLQTLKTIATPENIEVISKKEKTQNFGLLALLLTIITLGFLLKGTLKSKKSY